MSISLKRRPLNAFAAVRAARGKDISEEER
jgi:hypothetical protein